MFRFRRRSDFLLAVIDIGCSLLVAFIAYALRFEGTHVPNAVVERYQAASGALALAWMLAPGASGLYRRAALRLGERNVEPAVEAALVVGTAMFVVNEASLNRDLS